MIWPAQPFAPAPLQGLHHYYGLVRLCASHRYSPPRGRGHPGFSLLTTRGPTSPISTGQTYRDDRFSCSMPGPATSSRHLYTGHHQGHEQAAPWFRTRREATPLSRGRRAGLGFDVIVHIHDASAVVYACSSSRRSPDPLIAGLLRSRFPPRLLTGMTLRRFGISACTANPEGPPPSLTQQSSCWRSSTSSSLTFQDTPRPDVCRSGTVPSGPADC
jgi:hypothetical protein